MLPDLLAVSASSPFVDGGDTHLHSARTEIFTRVFPRCGVPDAYGSWAAYRDYLELLIETNSIVEYTQVWWSVRPHVAFGTVEMRICDAQATAEESEALAELIVACILQAAREVDEGVPFEHPPARLVEENLWRAIRFGLDGSMIDFAAREEVPSAGIVDRLLEWTAPVRDSEPSFPERNGAQRQRALLTGGGSLRDVYASIVEETQSSYGRAAQPAR
jgi:carboxylate-amine ligase